MARLDVRKTYALVTSLSWLFAVLPMPVMVLLAQSRGISLTEIGVVMALYSVTVAALEVPSGALADTLGRKRTFLLGGLLAIASRVAAVLAMDTAGFIVFALLFGVSRALTSGTLEAWFVDALQEEDASVDLQPALAAAGSFQLAGLAIGTLAGGALPDLFAGLSTEGFLTPLAVPMLASAAGQVVVLAVTAALVLERRAANAKAAPRALAAHIRGALASAVRTPHLRLLLLAEMAVGATVAASENLWQPFFAGLPHQLFGGGTTAMGVILAGSFGVGILGNVLATAVSSALGGRHALVAALFQVLQGGAFVALALSGGFLAAAALFWGTYLSRSAWGSPHQALYNREVGSRERSVMLSVSSLASFLGAAAGSVALGAVADGSSIGTAWSVAGALVAVTALLYVRFERLPRHEAGRAGAEVLVAEPG